LLWLRRPEGIKPGRVPLTADWALSDFCSPPSLSLSLLVPRAMAESMLHLVSDAEGCRRVQRLLEDADPETMQNLLRELAPAALDMVVSPHGNFVLAKMIEVAPAESVGLVITHLSGHAEETARHRYGCRIMCRLLQRSSKRNADPRLPELPGLEGLLEELLVKAQALCYQIFAHHVIQSVLENSPQHEHRHRIFEALHADLQRCAQDRHASFVIETALKCCCPRDVESLADSLIDMLPHLATSRFGSYIYNVLCVQESTKCKAIAALKEVVPMLQESTYGIKLVKQVIDPEAP